MKSTRLARVLGISLGAITVLGAGALFLPWILYATSSPFPGRFSATVGLSIVVGRELFTSCLRMPKKVVVAPSKDWTAAAVGFSYLGVLYACLAEIYLRRRGFPPLVFGVVGSSLYVFGLLLRNAALCHLGERWSIQLDQAGERDPGLVRSGPYAFIRHPIYLGAMLETLGVALFFGSPVAVAVAAMCFWPAEFARARFEERVLLVSLGDAYQVYCREVGGFLPRFRSKR
jgi:protein-S-isoprenylcysteine O-methyltransferase Ste14